MAIRQTHGCNSKDHQNPISRYQRIPINSPRLFYTSYGKLLPINHCNSHWCFSWTKDGTTFLCDSLLDVHLGLPEPLRVQLQSLLQSTILLCSINVLSVQQQNSGADCGCFAIALLCQLHSVNACHSTPLSKERWGSTWEFALNRGFCSFPKVIKVNQEYRLYNIITFT